MIENKATADEVDDGKASKEISDKELVEKLLLKLRHNVALFKVEERVKLLLAKVST